MSVRKKAHELAKALAESPEYKKLKEAREAIEEHEAAKLMLKDLQKKQEALREKYLSGEDITELEVEDLKRTSELAAFNPYVRQLMEAEFAFSEMMLEVQKIIGEAVGIDFEAQQEALRKAEEARQQKSRARSKLWTPSGTH